jgi:hypothetical protein
MKISAQDLFVPFANNKKLPKNFCISDADYFCPTKEMIINDIFPKYWDWLTSLNLTRWYHRWDCDNFADAFKLFSCGYYQKNIDSDANGIAIGTVDYVAIAKAEDGLQGAHAINIIYTQDNTKDEDGSNDFSLMFLEPQNGRIYNLTQEEFNSIYMIYI